MNCIEIKCIDCVFCSFKLKNMINAYKMEEQDHLRMVMVLESNC